MALRIAILGWGSLLWDPREEFDGHHENWNHDGPTLKIEFCRVSATRNDSLTLVLDQNGALCKVAYCLSTRTDPDDAICDLRSREGTMLRNIGYYFRDGSKAKSRDSSVLTLVESWAKVTKMDVVIWTDLHSNFEEKSSVKEKFTVPGAIKHLKGLDSKGKSSAFEYISRAPSLVQTPLREALETQPWFGG